ncbi:MAG TPA: hypothetical protein VFA35_04970 [Burkholderiaceae bacterium]|nr:hypothetical protein [Burkholderiaceae bacterium]
MFGKSLLRLFSILVALAFCVPSWAGVPILVTVTSPDDATNFNSSSVGTPVSATITFTGHSNTPGQVAQLSGIGLSGTNAADFAITGGTCANGTNLADGNTCTVTIRYLPSSVPKETAQLNLNCTIVAVLGGFSLSCSNAGASGSYALYGFAAAALTAVSAPLLDPKLLTALSAMLLGLGVFFAARRNA